MQSLCNITIRLDNEAFVYCTLKYDTLFLYLCIIQFLTRFTVSLVNGTLSYF